jgi:AAA+ superfamily predicted ATPase
MSALDRLAYEVRRLSSILIARVDETEIAPSAPGELALKLSRGFDLRPIDVDIALTTLAAELDAEFRQLLLRALPAGDLRSELGVLAALVPQLEARLASLDAVGPLAPIVTRKLVRRIEDASSARLVSTRRFRAAVLDQPVCAELPDYARMIYAPPRAPTWARSAPELARTMSAERGGSLCVVSGAPGVGKSSWAAAAAAHIGTPIVYIDLAAAVGRATGLEVRDLAEDAALGGHPVVLDNAAGFVADERRLVANLLELLEAASTRLFLIVDDVVRIDERLRVRALAHVKLDSPPASIRHELWSAGVPSELAVSLAEDLVLMPRQVENAVALVKHGGLDPVSAALEQLSGSSELTVPDFATARLESLVLPAETREEIVELINAIKHRSQVLADVTGSRGRGISALFDGDSGTGKTYSCEVVAAEVGLPLMRVNVSSLVDKYVGETEKNLSRVFAQARARGGILFFDEADALFGSRTDVSRAQDRYANLEVNLLLQLMELHPGIVLLTTNLKRNIDPAFMRRIMYKVYFELPDVDEREQLWRRLVGSRGEAAVSFRKLAQSFELSGGSIRSAVLRASYRSAAAGRKIEAVDLVECAKLETASMGRVTAWK